MVNWTPHKYPSDVFPRASCKGSSDQFRRVPCAWKKVKDSDAGFRGLLVTINVWDWKIMDFPTLDAWNTRNTRVYCSCHSMCWCCWTFWECSYDYDNSINFGHVLLPCIYSAMTCTATDSRVSEHTCIHFCVYINGLVCTKTHCGGV